MMIRNSIFFGISTFFGPNLFSYDRNRLIRVNTDIPSDDIILNAPIFLIEYIGEYNDGTSRRQYFPPLL